MSSIVEREASLEAEMIEKIHRFAEEHRCTYKDYDDEMAFMSDRDNAFVLFIENGIVRGLKLNKTNISPPNDVIQLRNLTYVELYLPVVLAVGLIVKPIITLITLVGFALLYRFNKKIRYKMLSFIYNDILDSIESSKRRKWRKRPVLKKIIRIVTPAVIVYLCIPKSSWIGLNVDFDAFNIENFYGECSFVTDSIYLNDAKCYNKDATIVMIGEQEYRCDSGEFCIEFYGRTTEQRNQEPLIYKLYSTINSTYFRKPSEVSFGFFPNNFRFDSDALIYEVDDYAGVDNIRVERHSGIGIYWKDTAYYDIYISSSNNPSQVNANFSAFSRTRINIKNGTNLYCNGSYEIKIKGMTIDESNQAIIVSNPSKYNESNSFIVQSERMHFSFAPSDRKAGYIRGDCELFDVKAGKRGELKRTYLNLQQTYDIALLNVAAITGSPGWEDRFKMMWELQDDVNSVQFSGLARSLTIAGREINFNPIIFLYENFSSVCLAIFGVIITIYADRVLKSKEESSEESEF